MESLTLALAGILGFVFGWPIICGLAGVVVLSFLLATEHEFVATFLLVAATLFVGYGVYAASGSIPWTFVGVFAVSYIIFGVFFIYPKWRMWTRKMTRTFSEAYDDCKTGVLKNTYGSHIEMSGFVEYWNNKRSKDVYKVRFVGEADNQTVDVYFDKGALAAYLATWVLNWPFYLVLLAVEDFVIEAAHWLAERVGGHFRKIATAAFNDAIRPS